ncbi:MAG: hypothetical protein M3Y46_10095, partial [Actinomycetota bacterium]|nr:hypothetical protein [Actinomycetota bacterium]
MKTVFRKTTTAVAAVATAGVSGLFMGAAPAAAATETCGEVGTLVAPGICELVFTSDGVFTRTPEMTKLEVLLVGAGGNSVGSPYAPESEGQPDGSVGYASGGGGGEVRVVDFSSTSGPITVTVAQHAESGSETAAIVGADEEVALNGANGVGPSTGFEGDGSGGDSGNGNDGAEYEAPSAA